MLVGYAMSARSMSTLCKGYRDKKDGEYNTYLLQNARKLASRAPWRQSGRSDTRVGNSGPNSLSGVQLSCLGRQKRVFDGFRSWFDEIRILWFGRGRYLGRRVEGENGFYMPCTASRISPSQTNQHRALHPTSLTHRTAHNPHVIPTLKEDTDVICLDKY